MTMIILLFVIMYGLLFNKPLQYLQLHCLYAKNFLLCGGGGMEVRLYMPILITAWTVFVRQAFYTDA